jgi:hypothetical protein
MAEWIKCNERMPPDGAEAVHVLLWGPKYGPFVGFFNRDRFYAQDDCDGWVADDWQPTHWQSLPEPPNA